MLDLADRHARHRQNVLLVAVGAYIGVSLMANVMSVRIVLLGPWAIDAGTFTYPLTFTLRDVVHKAGGRTAARVTIVTGAALNLVMALEKHGVKPADGEIVVTGAAGGVGSVAIAVLSKLGYTVVAVSGRPEEADYLKQLGASEVLERSAFSAPGKPLGKERWAGAVDVVGSHTLANICATTRYRGVVTACGLAGGMDLPASVAPFILRGVTLVGIDSVMCPRPDRLVAWQRLARDLDVAKLGLMTHEVSLAEAIPAAARLMEGKVRGRVVVDVNR